MPGCSGSMDGGVWRGWSRCCERRTLRLARTRMRCFMAEPTPTIRVQVDPTNPGQFFACCGLLELAERLWPGAEGWFEGRQFCIECEGTLTALLDCLLSVPLELVDESDIYSSPA